MSQSLQAIRGMQDILPHQTPIWQHIEAVLCDVLSAYGYQEIRFPILEKTELFARAVGEVTDIVEKEMYTFEDRNGDSLSLRPEGTAGCVRAGIENDLLYNQVQRLWYVGPMFRHERPQQGRYRQFYQLGVEAFGMPGPDIDVEQILLMASVWHRLGLSDYITLQINNLGTQGVRATHRQQLIKYFESHQTALDKDSQRRLMTNPLRILDSKNPDMQDLIQGAPKIIDYLDQTSQQHFDRLKRLLDAVKIHYEINPCLVRGLDYYDLTVYEWVSQELGAQNAVCAGGRYDGLVGQLGGKPTPAVGLAMGFERVVALLEKKLNVESTTDIYLVLLGDNAVVRGLQLAEKWRHSQKRLRLVCGFAGSLKSQMKRADKSGAHLALILGEEELKNDSIAVKFLREDKPQAIIKLSDVENYLKKLTIMRPK